MSKEKYEEIRSQMDGQRLILMEYKSIMENMLLLQKEALEQVLQLRATLSGELAKVQSLKKGIKNGTR